MDSMVPVGTFMTPQELNTLHQMCNHAAEYLQKILSRCKDFQSLEVGVTNYEDGGTGVFVTLQTSHGPRNYMSTYNFGGAWTNYCVQDDSVIAARMAEADIGGGI